MMSCVALADYGTNTHYIDLGSGQQLQVAGDGPIGQKENLADEGECSAWNEGMPIIQLYTGSCHLQVTPSRAEAAQCRHQCLTPRPQSPR